MAANLHPGMAEAQGTLHDAEVELGAAMFSMDKQRVSEAELRRAKAELGMAKAEVDLVVSERQAAAAVKPTQIFTGSVWRIDAKAFDSGWGTGDSACASGASTVSPTPRCSEDVSRS
mmetsp:Transcript_11511/g.22723  ORF Transcript_11511/g.22723 Transcript_11511/m.22723 type:complete len:117 (+) Transcript_11511:327-677(+)